MSDTAHPGAVIVSHGQPSEPQEAEAQLTEFTAAVRACAPGLPIESATLAAPGALDAALGRLGPGPLIYPLFMTEGWFTGDALRSRLAGRPAHILRPLGVDPDLVPLAADLLRATIADRGWTEAGTRLFVAGHGSGRSPNSERDTRAFADALEQLLSLQDLRVGFVEQAPYLADAAQDLGPRAICLPFFAMRRGHVIDDIPEALDKARFQGLLLDPIGSAPRVPALVAAALARAAQPA